ncbi:hypothetical protein [Chitinibacter tainanensis]|uniref:hypothetical protein n=1 Tax=Chitinibacter tainanensis TaxID=230667 RepID=UPI002352C608|nr:hypothetical protein [Chitinibacter tainanensis]
MSVDPGILQRVVGMNPEVLEGLSSGRLRIEGGVIRITAGHKGAGQIFAHLRFPNDPDAARSALESLQNQISKMSEGIDGLQSGINLVKNLQIANLALSGLNLAVSAVGFVVVCNKLNKINDILNYQTMKIDQLLELAIDSRQREEFRDLSRFGALLKTVRQFAEEGEVTCLKSLIKDVNEQYCFTRLVLENVASKFKEVIVDRHELLDLLQDRLINLALVRVFVQYRVGYFGAALSDLNEFQSDWLKINERIVKEISSDPDWIGAMTMECSKKVKNYLELRKVALPSLEYQAQLLEAYKQNPALVDYACNDAEIRILIAA